MTFDDHVAALGFLGLTPRQTRFVATVALHGGYCLRRQYATFAGIAYGATVRDFLDLLVRRRVMTRVEYRRDRGFIYHLQAKPIYRAIDQDDNRNRRAASPALIARKLMLLDVVLAHPSATWFATEADKVALFTGRFGVPLVDLPRRVYMPGDRRDSAWSASIATLGTTRYFVNKWPIFLTAGEETPRVYFVALILDSSGRAFSQFLSDHARLVARLSAWTAIAVCPSGQSGLAASRAVFDREAVGAKPGSGADVDGGELGRYFRTRLAVELGDLASVTIADLDHYREARTRVIGPGVERGYARWRASGCLSTRNICSGHTSAEFQPYQLPFTYHQFGDFAGEC